VQGCFVICLVLRCKVTHFFNNDQTIKELSDYKNEIFSRSYQIIWQFQKPKIKHISLIISYLHTIFAVIFLFLLRKSI